MVFTHCIKLPPSAGCGCPPGTEPPVPASEVQALRIRLEILEELVKGLKEQCTGGCCPAAAAQAGTGKEVTTVGGTEKEAGGELGWASLVYTGLGHELEKAPLPHPWEWGMQPRSQLGEGSLLATFSPPTPTPQPSAYKPLGDHIW